MRLVILTIVTVFLLSACNTVTTVPNGSVKRTSKPTFQARQNYFLFGLIGENHIDVKKVCGAKPATQMQSQDTFGNVLLRLITLGIYSPRTAKVWCQP